jgi:hypothetical protein
MRRKSIMMRLMLLKSFDVIGGEPALSAVGLGALPPPAVVHFQHRDNLQCRGYITGGTFKAQTNAAEENEGATATHLFHTKRQLRRFLSVVIEFHLAAA